MAQGESKLSRRIMTELEKHGAFTFKIHGGPFMMAGLPDIICCFQGRFYALETKMEKGKVSPIQSFVHKKIEAAGGVVHVVRSVDDALRAVGLR